MTPTGFTARSEVTIERERVGEKIEKLQLLKLSLSRKRKKVIKSDTEYFSTLSPDAAGVTMRALFVFVMSLMWNVGFCEEPRGSERGPLPPPFNPTGLVTSHKHGCTGHTESRKGESWVKFRIQRRSNTCFHHTANCVCDSLTKKFKQIDIYRIMSRRRIDNKPSRGFMLDHIYTGLPPN